MPAHEPITGCSPGLFAYFDQLWYAASETQRSTHLTPRVPSLENTAADQLVEDQRARLAFDHALRVITPAILDNVPALVDHADRIRSLPFGGGIERPVRLAEFFQSLSAEMAIRLPLPQGDISNANRRRELFLRGCEKAAERVLRVSGFVSCINCVRIGSEVVKGEAGGNRGQGGKLRYGWKNWVMSVRGVTMCQIRAAWTTTLTNAQIRTISQDDSGEDNGPFATFVRQLAAGVDVTGLAGQALNVLDSMIGTTAP